jgi:hypothetical protein
MTEMDIYRTPFHPYNRGSGLQLAPGDPSAGQAFKNDVSIGIWAILSGGMIDG